MQIEAGNYYRTRDGRKIGPAAGPTEPGNYRVGDYYLYPSGQVAGIPSHPDAAVAEWSEGPVRTETVTKRRIVPGVYGRLRVGQVVNVPDCNNPDEPPQVQVDLELIGYYGLTATELDDIAMVASQLAEALRDGLD